MAAFTNFWKIVTPPSRNKIYNEPVVNLDDGMNLNTAGYAAFSTVTWFSNLLKGSTARMQRYKQYDAMDIGDVSRALDITAEEISNADDRTGLPFVINYQVESDQNLSDALTVTLRSALRYWSNFQELNRKVYKISRTLIKYGDCFFRKTSDTKKWEYVDPTRILGIEINASGENIAYHIRPSSFKNTINDQSAKGQADSLEVVPAAAIIHFTLSDEMGDSAPFGLSVLQSAFRDWQKLTMLEDASIIYRIVRAPERRVFYIDVGNMPPQRVKQYLEQVKNEIRQRKIPNTANANQTDAQYSPECLALDTLIPLLDGRTVTLQMLIDEYKAGKINWTYSINPETGEQAPGIITWAGVTRKNAKRIKLTLDNGKEIIVTPDHKFPVQGKGFIEAQNITSNDSLYPFTSRKIKMYGASPYEQVWDSASKSWRWTHRIVAEFMKQAGKHTIFSYKKNQFNLDEAVVHHIDYDRFNNSPANLTFMDREDHLAYHRDTKKQWWKSLSATEKLNACAAISDGTKEAMKKIPDSMRSSQIARATAGIKAYHDANKILPTEKYITWKNTSAARIKSLSNLEYIRELRRINGKKNNNLPANQSLAISQEAISRIITVINNNNSNKLETLNLLENDEIFMSIFRNDNPPLLNKVNKIHGNRVTDKYLKHVYRTLCIPGWKKLKEISKHYNHKVIKIEEVENADVGTITIDGGETFHNYHTFALDAGVFTKNSIQEDFFFGVTAGGRGSKVETLPGGATWEIPELDYFLNKVFRALRVPTSYMKGQDAQGAQYNDGKVGIAYIEELRFANYIKRLQACVEGIFDHEFKTYLKVAGIKIDSDIFRLSLPEPQNFALYRQAALDAEMINAFNSIEGVKYLSKRFILKRYLGLTDDDIQMNELMLKQEREIFDHPDVRELQQIYDPAVYDSRESISVPEPTEVPAEPLSA